MPLTTLFASSLALGAMAQVDLLPFDTYDYLDSISVDPTTYTPQSSLYNVFTQQCQITCHPNEPADERNHTSYNINKEVIDEQILSLESHSDKTFDILISHTENAESIASPPEGYQEHPFNHPTLNKSGATVYAWTFIATATALIVRFLITQQETNVKNSLASSFRSWLHQLSDKLDRFDYWHAFSRLYITENVCTDDWLGFDSFLEWIEIVIENVGRVGMEICGC